MRTHIAKSLQTRCKAIQNAVKAYNAVALAMDPPRPTGDWSKASHYSFLEDFDLLRDTRHDIRSKPWATPVVRTVMKQRQRILRAEEEIFNCNIKIRRLHTHILDEGVDLKKITRNLSEQGHPIAGAVKEYTVRRLRANAHLLVRILQIHSLKGYSGNTAPGVRVGRLMSSSVGSMDVMEESQSPTPDDDEGDIQDFDDNKQLRGEYGGLIDFVSDMPLRS